MTLAANVQCAMAKQRFWTFRGDREEQVVESHVAFAAAIFTLAPVMTPFDEDFATQLKFRCKEISDLLPTHNRPCRSRDLARADKLLADLILAMGDWLAKRVRS
ncbi:hypothetical protein [Nonomuraea lactucae]|uniref:hypothetical protein n=1 Tax=Nonomuraea lactucae TaxID=2249762 RepID=UPI0013B4551B|nr:hypothetical protein [Nonomuraea lactucae]